MKLRRCQLVLASASPRRRELLAEMGYRFETVPPAVDEAVDPALPAERQAEALAERKAEAVAAAIGNRELPESLESGAPGPIRSIRRIRGRRSFLVLAADTLVACEGRVIGKAADEAQAREFLRLLTTHRHAVITGLCVLDTATGERQVVHDVTWVTMRRMSEAELDAYIAGCGWRDKAGAYAIQEGGDRFIERLDGSESNVVGLPVELVARLVPYTFGEYLGELRRDLLARHGDLLLTEDALGRGKDTRCLLPERPSGCCVQETAVVFSPVRFPRPDAPLEVEIGPGKDDFVVRAAREHPGTDYLAIERLRERVDSLCGKIRRAGVGNVRVFYGDARAALDRLLRPGDVQAFYIHFPDPWPKRRHGRHRLVQPAVTARLSECLAPDGRITVVTDARVYAEQILECLEATPGLVNLAGKGQWATELPGYHQSVYEKKRRAAGCVIYYMRFARTAAPVGEAP